MRVTRDEVVAEARKWIGVRYRNRGRDANGLDCVGLLVVMGRAFGIEVRDRSDYSNWPAHDHLIMKELEQYLTFVPPTTAKPGLFGVFAEARLPGHAGVFSEKHGQVHLIHARLTHGMARVLEEPWDQVPRRHLRLIALYALPGLEL